MIYSSLFILATREHLSLDSNTSILKGLKEYTEPYIRRHVEQANTEESDLVAKPDNMSHVNSCLPYILYDKPIKTGSSSIVRALSAYLESISDPPIHCKSKSHCASIGEEICIGKRPPGHLLQHTRLNSSMTACLRNMGYYHVTSIREPKERMISSWRYAHRKQVNYFHIPCNATIEEYLDRVPKCSLYNYYDLLANRCTKEQAERRAKEIVSRFDEIIELSDDVISDIHRRILPFLKERNVSPGGRSKTTNVNIPDEASEIENLLYRKLREKRQNMAKTPGRVLCGM